MARVICCLLLLLMAAGCDQLSPPPPAAPARPARPIANAPPDLGGMSDRLLLTGLKLYTDTAWAPAESPSPRERWYGQAAGPLALIVHGPAERITGAEVMITTEELKRPGGAEQFEKVCQAVLLSIDPDQYQLMHAWLEDYLPEILAATKPGPGVHCVPGFYLLRLEPMGRGDQVQAVRLRVLAGGSGLDPELLARD